MQDTVIVAEVETSEAAKVRKTLEKAIKQVNASTFDIAILLHTVRSKHLFTQPTWGDYLETLELKVRKSQYLERIVEVMEAVGIPRAEYEPIGVTKLRVISRLNPADTYTNPKTNEVLPMADYIAGLIEIAPETKTEQIEKHVRVLKGEIGENDMTWLNIRLPRLVLEATIEPAFEKAAINIGTVTTDGEGVAQDAPVWRCLEVVCIDYVLDPQTDPEVS